MSIQIPNASLKALFFLHLILGIWAAEGGWVPTSYLIYNSFFWIEILLTIHLKDSEEAPFMGVCLNVVCALMDIVVFIIYWPSSSTSSLNRFGGICAFGNLLLRLVSTVTLYRIFQNRVSTFGNFVMPNGVDAFFAGHPGASSYEDLDRNEHGPTATEDNKRSSTEQLFAT